MVGTSLGGGGGGEVGMVAGGVYRIAIFKLTGYDIPLGTRAESVSVHVSGKVHRKFWRRYVHTGLGKSVILPTDLKLVLSETDFRPRRSEAHIRAWQIRIFTYLRSQKKCAG